MASCAVCCTRTSGGSSSHTAPRRAATAAICSAIRSSGASTPDTPSGSRSASSGPAVVGLAVTRSWSGALRAWLWGGAVRIFVVQQGTYGINSVCHLFGTRPFETNDRSTNNAWLAPLSLGGSWHNNHHAFPSSAFNSIDWWHLDPAGAFIRLLSWVGLVRDAKRPSARAIALKRARGAKDDG
ncbi:MAG: acyl-CoA desaturase [Sandaracinaceae bacterium]|nr:acyl-CoA desaturase [Sandaracinaceae bacterium]